MYPVIRRAKPISGRSRSKTTPVRSFTQADWIVWEFAIPVGDSLNVDLGPRLDPSLQSGASGRTALLEDGRPLLEVVFATHVVP